MKLATPYKAKQLQPNLTVQAKTACVVLLITIITALATLAPDTANANPYKRRAKQFAPLVKGSRTDINLSFGIRRDSLEHTVPEHKSTQTVNPDETDFVNPAPIVDPNDVLIVPNVRFMRTETKWSNVQMAELGVNLKHSNTVKYGRVFLEAGISGAYTLSGEMDYTDYDGRRGFTQSLDHVKSEDVTGFAFDLHTALGYEVNLLQRIRRGSQTALTVAPMIGYKWNNQRYNDEKLVYVDQYDEAGDILFVGINAPYGSEERRYKAVWHGPFIGLETKLHHNRHTLGLRGELDFLNYRSDGLWKNLNQKVEDISQGSGTKLEAFYNYQLKSGSNVGLRISHTERTADQERRGHRARIKGQKDDKGVPTGISTTFYGAKQTSQKAHIEINFPF